MTVAVDEAAGGFTVRVSGGDVLPAKFPAAPYAAVTECVPVAGALVVRAACPVASSPPVPTVAPSTANVTTPAGVPAPLVTVAVKVTLSPTVTGLADGVRDVDVVAGATVCATPDEALAANAAVPAYCAV
jgi:hypothetical protein